MRAATAATRWLDRYATPGVPATAAAALTYGLLLLLVPYRFTSDVFDPAFGLAPKRAWAVAMTLSGLLALGRARLWAAGPVLLIVAGWTGYQIAGVLGGKGQGAGGWVPWFWLDVATMVAISRRGVRGRR